MKILGIGNALVDILLNLESDETLDRLNIKKGAMDLVQEDQMKSLQQEQSGLKRNESPGGSVCNSMRAMARLGAHVGYVGKLGNDTMACFYEDAILKAGVNPYFVRSEGISGCSTVLISPDGERTMATFLGPAATLTASDISDETLRKYDLVYIEGYLISNDKLFLPILERIHRLGIKVALDLSNFNIVNGFKDLLSEVIPKYVNILFSNESEAEAFTGLPAKESVQYISKFVDISIVTVGKDGAWAGNLEELIQVPAIGGKPLDTTGAGDNFAAGFLYGQAMGASIKQSAEIGALLAGSVIDIIGPQIPNERWDDIKEEVSNILL